MLESALPERFLEEAPVTSHIDEHVSSTVWVLNESLSPLTAYAASDSAHIPPCYLFPKMNALK